MTTTVSHFATTSHQARVLAQIKTIVAEVFKDKTCTVYLFGSRATGAFIVTSDFDVAVLATGDISPKLSLIREKLDQSNIPFKVDLIDLGSTSTEFSRQVQREGVVLWKN
jgi:predicted nucleotidyltransferase